jgi:hypothetical protein
LIFLMVGLILVFLIKKSILDKNMGNTQKRKGKK